jgi:hypothetical protein
MLRQPHDSRFINVARQGNRTLIILYPSDRLFWLLFLSFYIDDDVLFLEDGCAQDDQMVNQESMVLRAARSIFIFGVCRLLCRHECFPGMGFGLRNCTRSLAAVFLFSSVRCKFEWNEIITVWLDRNTTCARFSGPCGS